MDSLQRRCIFILQEARKLFGNEPKVEPGWGADSRWIINTRCSAVEGKGNGCTRRKKCAWMRDPLTFNEDLAPNAFKLSKSISIGSNMLQSLWLKRLGESHSDGWWPGCVCFCCWSCQVKVWMRGLVNSCGINNAHRQAFTGFWFVISKGRRKSAACSCNRVV